MSSAGARDSPQNIIKSVECSRRDTARRVALGPLSRLVCRVPAAAYGQHRENLVALAATSLAHAVLLSWGGGGRAREFRPCQLKNRRPKRSGR